MKLRLTQRDIELITFVGKYKKIKAIDCKKIYKSKDYYRKRLKVLEKSKYINRDKRIIKLDEEGRKLFNMFGYKSYNLCRNKDYQERVDDIVKIATLSLGSDIEFTSSWQMKDNKIYTDYGKKYIGKLKYQGEDYIAYYISKRNTLIYVKQILTDIDISLSFAKVILFIEDLKILNKTNKYFITNKESTLVINVTEQNLELMRFLEEIDMHDILQKIYIGQEILLSNWNKADYMTEDGKYIICMPFIDVEKIHKLNCRDNSKRDIVIDIVTMKENTEKIKEILKENVNIIELDTWIEELRKSKYLNNLL